MVLLQLGQLSTKPLLDLKEIPTTFEPVDESVTVIDFTFVTVDPSGLVHIRS